MKVGKLYKPGERDPKVKVGLYGYTKVGKTALATHLPDRFGRIIYIASDKGSEDLLSTSPAMHKRIDVFSPGPDLDANGKPLPYDPVTEAIKLASRNWQDEGYDTIIWDTLTATAEIGMRAIAESGLYGKNIKVGKGQDSVTQSQPGDYGMAQNFALQVVDHLLEQPLHVIVLFHSAIDDGDAENLVGGPATVGKAKIGVMGGRLNDILKVSIERKQIPQTMPPKWETWRAVHTKKHGIWTAGLRMDPALPNPGMIKVEEGNPAKFWDDLAQIRNGENT